MKRYAKFGYAAPFRFRVILEKPQGGGQNDPPPPGRRLRKTRGVGKNNPPPSATNKVNTWKIFSDDKCSRHTLFNPRPAGPLDFPPPAGGGGRLNAPPWSRLLVAVEKNER